MESMRKNGVVQIGTGVLEPRQVDKGLKTRFVYKDAGLADKVQDADYLKSVALLYGTDVATDAKDKARMRLLVITAANLTFDAAKSAGKTEAVCIFAAANAAARLTYRGIVLEVGEPVDAIGDYPDEYGVTLLSIRKAPSGKASYDDELPKLNFTFPEFGELVTMCVQFAIVAKIQWWRTNHHLGATDRKSQKNTYLARIVKRIKEATPWFRSLMEAVNMGQSTGEGDVVESNELELLWNLVHQWPTRSIWHTLTEGASHTDEPMWDTRVKREQGAYSTVQGVENSMPIAIGRELKMRVGAPGEGTALVLAAATVIRQTIASRLYTFLPERGCAVEVLKLDRKWRKDPLAFGTGSNYLTGNLMYKAWAPSDADQALFSDLAFYCDRVSKSKSMKLSGLFIRYQNTDPSVTWQRVCMAYIKLVRGDDLSDQKVIEVLKGAIVVTAGVMTDEEQRVLDTVAGPEDREAIQSMFVAMAAEKPAPNS